MYEEKNTKEENSECKCGDVLADNNPIILCCCKCGKKIEYYIPKIQTGYTIKQNPEQTPKPHPQSGPQPGSQTSSVPGSQQGSKTNGIDEMGYELPPLANFFLRIIELFDKKQVIFDSTPVEVGTFNGCVYHKDCDTFYTFIYKVVNKWP